MASQANLLCCPSFDKTVQAKHMGGIYVQTDLGRTPKFVSKENGWELGLPNGSWGDPEWHDYCLNPDGRFDGDCFHGDEGKPFAKEKKRQIEGYDFESWGALMDNPDTTPWEEMGAVEPRDDPCGAYYNSEDEHLNVPADFINFLCAFIVRKGDLIDLKVEKVLSGGVRFFSERVKEDGLVGGQRSIRIPLLRNKPSLPFLEGETVTARVTGVSTKPPKKKSQTDDGRKYVFLLVEVVAVRSL